MPSDWDKWNGHQYHLRNAFVAIIEKKNSIQIWSIFDIIHSRHTPPSKKKKNKNNPSSSVFKSYLILLMNPNN